MEPTVEEQNQFFDILNSDQSEEEIANQIEALPEHVKQWGYEAISKAFLDNTSQPQKNRQSIEQG